MSFDGKSQLDFFLWRGVGPEILLVRRLISISADRPIDFFSAHPSPVLGHVSPRDKKLFCSFNIYNEASETFAGA